MKNYIIRREKPKQGLRHLFPILLGQCDDAQKSKIRKWSNFKAPKDRGSVLELIGTTDKE